MFPIFIRVRWLHVKAMTLWFIVVWAVSYDVDGEVIDLDEETRNHETIHYHQYNELFVIPFLLLYWWYWIRAYWRLRDFWGAYYLIPFEQEAHENDKNLEYLKTRERFAWRKYTIDLEEDSG